MHNVHAYLGLFNGTRLRRIPKEDTSGIDRDDKSDKIRMHRD
jgi:hypothetical protein